VALFCQDQGGNAVIPVSLKPEPADFNSLVREPGERFLRRIPAPKGKQWKPHAYWTKVLHELHDAYGGICAYSCHWIPSDTGFSSVEHFQPKDIHPQLAYEWSNYRLVAGILNGRRGTHQDVLDPFAIQADWFMIEFPSLLVKPAAHLEHDIKVRVRATIERLGLNEEQTCRKNRRRYVLRYCQGKLPFEHLEDEAPFIAYELIRQNLVVNIREIMGVSPAP
jgi:hypothetical protein